VEGDSRGRSGTGAHGLLIDALVEPFMSVEPSSTAHSVSVIVDDDSAHRG
jgi:hypothetical protein